MLFKALVGLLFATSHNLCKSYIPGCSFFAFALLCFDLVDFNGIYINFEILELTIMTSMEYDSLLPAQWQQKAPVTSRPTTYLQT